MDQTTPEDFSLLQEQVRTALQRWHRTTREPSPLATFHLFRRQLHDGVTDAREATNRVLLLALQLLEERHKQEATLLRRSALDNELDERLANELNIAPSTLYRHKNNALRHLTEALWELEQSARAAQRDHLLTRLPPATSTHLLGIEQHLAALVRQLTEPAPPWIVALAGMGGIGKTSLADAVVRHLVEEGAVQEIAWVTVRQGGFPWEDVAAGHATPEGLQGETLSAEILIAELCDQLLGSAMLRQLAAPQDRLAQLRVRLKEHPHLIVVDNLETLVDVEVLLSTLHDLAGPSKFLLTSRESLFARPGLYHFPVPELRATDALALMRQEAAQRNLSALHSATDDDLLPVFDVVGGNPLALRLVIGQTFIYPLATVINNLKRAQGASIEALYTFIYRHAWNQLEEPARQAWLVMPLVNAAGADLDYLVAISEMPPATLLPALETLVRLNLVDVRGDLHQRRYTIHNLTRTFLHEQVIRWQ